MQRESNMFMPKLSVIAGLTAMLCSASGASATVVLTDGFGDADRNNDAAITYLDFDISGNDDFTADSYEPPAFVGTTINEVTVAEDALDTGIKWFGLNGWTSSPSADTGHYNEKAYLRTIDDTAGLSPEGNSIDSGLALAVDSKGRGGIAAGFFGQNVALGANVGDQVKVSFDMRLWESAPNLNPQYGTGLEADLRWGLFQDTDNQIGTTNSIAGEPDAGNPFGSPAVFGEADGYFKGDWGPAGSNGDAGWATRIKLLEDSDPTGLDDPINGSGPRIFEETNIDPGTSPTAVKIMEGGDNDFVAKPDQLDPQFTSLVNGKVYNLALTLERTAASIYATYTVTNLTDGLTFTFGGEESLSDSTGIPGSGGIQSDNWDYFALRVSSASSFNEEDIDLIIDNFLLEECAGGCGGTAIAGDLDEDGFVGITDLNIVLGNWNMNVPPADDRADPSGDGFVGIEDLNTVLSNWNAGTPPAAGTVPEPATLALFGLGGMAMLRRRR